MPVPYEKRLTEEKFLSLLALESSRITYSLMPEEQKRLIRIAFNYGYCEGHADGVITQAIGD